MSAARAATRLGRIPATSGYPAARPQRVVDLASGVPRCQVPTGRRVPAQDTPGPALDRYSPPAGDPRLLARIEALYRGRPGLAPGAALVTAGSVHALDAVVRAHVNPGEEVLIPDPGFPPYRSIVRFSGGIPVPYRLRHDSGAFRLDLDDLRRKIGPRTRLLVVNSPHNPTGHILDRHEAGALDDLLSAHPQVAYVADEVYAGLYRAPRLFPSGSQATGVVVDGLSKSHALAGCRIGWLYGDPQMVAQATQVVEHTAGCVSAPSQAEAMAALDASSHALGDRCARARAIAVQILDDTGIPHVTPQRAIYAFVSHGRDDAKVVAQLRAEGVLVVPGGAFGRVGSGWLRATCAVPEDDLVRGFGVLAQTLRARGYGVTAPAGGGDLAAHVTGPPARAAAPPR